MTGSRRLRGDVWRVRCEHHEEGVPDVFRDEIHRLVREVVGGVNVCAFLAKFSIVVQFEAVVRPARSAEHDLPLVPTRLHALPEELRRIQVLAEEAGRVAHGR